MRRDCLYTNVELAVKVARGSHKAHTGRDIMMYLYTALRRRLGATNIMWGLKLGARTHT
jgi:hypothetical protein